VDLLGVPTHFGPNTLQERDLALSIIKNLAKVEWMQIDTARKGVPVGNQRVESAFALS
jgi:hypothetical protein